MPDPSLRSAGFAGAAALILAVALVTSDLGGFATRLREASFDLMGGISPPTRSVETVVVIDIDRQSLASKGSWPWRRGMLADLVQKVQAGRPKAIGIDILLSGSDRRSPASVLRAIATETGREDLAALSSGLPDDDLKLGTAIAQSDIVLGLVLDSQSQDKPPAAPPVFMVGRPKPLRFSDSMGVAAPLPVLAERAFATGALSFSAGPGGIVREVPMFVGGAGQVYAGFAAEVLRAREKAASFVLEDGPTVTIGAVKIPFSPSGSVRVRYTSAESWHRRTVSAAAVLDGLIDPIRFENRMVLIGSSAPEAGALIATPVAPLTPTVQLQAEALETFQSGVPNRLSYHVWIEPLAALMLALAAIAAVLFTAPALSALILFGIAFGWIGLSFVGLGYFNRLIDPVGPLVPALTAWNVASVVLFARTRKLRNAIERKFGRYLSPEIVKRLTRSPGELKIEGELREITALFTDIEGFSAISETAEPRMLVAALDAYFEGVCAIVIRHGGMVDKVVGDAVHALFNAPLDLPHHARAAFDCALEIETFTANFCKQDHAKKLQFGRTKIGLETGPAIVGDVGGLGHLDYTAHGDAVNSAARLEALNKQFGTTICVGKRAAAAIALPDLLRPLSETTLRGHSAPTLVYTPWGSDMSAENRQLYLSAYALVTTQPQQAFDLFKALACRLPNDLATAYWARHLAACYPDEQSHAPAAYQATRA